MANVSTSTLEKRDNGIGVVHLEGRIDITSAANVKQLFSSTVTDGSPRLVVDLSDVAFIDSSGLSALVSGLRSARQAGGDLRIAAAGRQPTTLFSLTSLDRVFHLYPTVEDAVNAYDN